MAIYFNVNTKVLLTICLKYDIVTRPLEQRLFESEINTGRKRMRCVGSERKKRSKNRVVKKNLTTEMPNEMHNAKYA